MILLYRGDLLAYTNPMLHKTPPQRPTIGYIACDVLEEVSRGVWQGVAEAAREQDFNLIFYAGGALNDPLGFRRHANVIYDLVNQQRIDGLIIMASSIDFSASSAEMQAFLARFAGLPIVTIEESFPGIPSVLVDEYGGMTQVVKHLIDKHKRRRIIFMPGPSGTICSTERLRAYRDVLESRGLPFDPNLITPTPSSWSFEEARKLFQQYLQELALRPRFDFDAIAAVNDETAYAAISVLKEKGVRVPDDISVTGFDDLAMAGSIAPPLTTIRPSFNTIGQKAVESLKCILHDERTLHDERGIVDEISVQTLILPAQLVVRHSCGCLLPTIAEAVLPSKDRLPRGAQDASGLAAILARERQSIVAEMARVVGGSAQAQSGSAQLLNGFIGEIEHGTAGAFLSAMDEVLDQSALKGERVKEWQRAISVLRRRILPHLTSEPARTAADDLWQQARVMAGEFAWRNQSWKRLQSEDKARQLRNLGSQLSTTLDMADLMTTLATELVALGIPRCYLSLYEVPGRVPSLAHLEMGFDAHGPLQLDPGEEVFPACLLAPAPVWDQKERFSLLVEPLYLRSEQFGFMVFETIGWEGSREADLWTTIQQQVSSSIKAALLHRDAENARREAEAGWRLAEERRQSAEEANQLKSRFLSMVSHEMRTPLNVIAGLSENLIQQSAADAFQPGGSHHRDLERIHASAQHLDSLIRDVLDLAVSHVGQLKLVLEQLDVAEAISGVVDISERMAAEKGLAWQVEIPEHLPKISYDRTRLRQILLNLIGNAVKFTEKGEVVLRVQREGETIHFSVRDTGLGIPAADQSLIFEEFRRSERAATRGFGGLGLGLAICRRLVELGDGRIGVQSSGEMGGGSTFYFSLPALPDSTPSTPIDTNARILLLTDCSGMGGLSGQLAQNGFIVDEICIDAQKNWMDRLGEAPPGAIIMGYGSSPEVGWEAINAIKNNPSTREIPILICSLSADHGAILELNYLEKPIEEQQLLHALEQKGLLHDLPPRDILLIDDDPAILDLHARLVERHLPGSSVRRAASGRAGLGELRQNRPDLVLLDLMMPEVNGFDVLREMRESEDLRGIPVIVLTSQKLSEYEMEQLNNGVAAVLEKGLFSASETLLQLEAVLTRRKHLGSEARRLARLSMAYIHEHYREPIARKDLADYARVSQEYLSTCFHRETGITPSDYIERYRIKQAKRLLETTDQPVTRVAMEVGFYDSSYFGRVFRREVGVSPLAYRKGGRK